MPETGNNTDARTHLRDDSFQPERPEAYTLYLLIGINDVSCAVAETASGTFVAIESAGGESPEGALEELIEQSPLLESLPYRKVICGIALEPPVMVPVPLFDASLAAAHFEFCFGRKPTGELMSDRVQQAGCINIFEVPHFIANVLNRRFPDITYYHSATAVAGYLLSEGRSIDEAKMSVNTDKGKADVYVTRGKDLVYTNHFTFESAEELVYYLVFVSEQLDLNTDTIQLTFSGDIKGESDTFTLTEKYIRHVTLAHRPAHTQYAGVFKQLPEHQYFNLFCLKVCAS